MAEENRRFPVFTAFLGSPEKFIRIGPAHPAWRFLPEIFGQICSNMNKLVFAAVPCRKIRFSDPGMHKRQKGDR
jgi:hypothetical protein